MCSKSVLLFSENASLNPLQKAFSGSQLSAYDSKIVPNADCRTHGATICISEVRDIQYCISQGARVLKNFGAPLATKFTYKMRSGG